MQLFLVELLAKIVGRKGLEWELKYTKEGGLIIAQDLINIFQ